MKPDNMDMKQLIIELVTPLKESIDTLAALTIKVQESIDRNVEQTQSLQCTTASLIETLNQKIETNTTEISHVSEQVTELKTTVVHQNDRILSLTEQVEDLEQKNYASQAILSGSKVTALIQSNPNIRFADSATSSEFFNSVRALAQNGNELNWEQYLPIISAHPISKHKIGVTCNSRDNVLKIFGKAKDTANLFAAERLTKSCDKIMYDLRCIRNSVRNPTLQVTLFTRNGVPMAKLDDDDPIPIKSSKTIDEFRLTVQSRDQTPTDEATRRPGGP